MRALVEVRVLQEVSKLREYNKRDLEDIRKEELRNWKTLSFVLLFLTLFITFIMWFYTKEQLANGINQAVDNKLIEPNLEREIDAVIAKDSIKALELKLTPFTQAVADLRNQFTSLKGVTTEAEGLSKQAQSLTGS